MWVIAVIVLIICFSFVVFIGPPYLPTLTPQVKSALDMLDLKPGQTMLELGCGDGKVLVAAAQRGWKVTGIELNPILVLVCLVRTWRYRKLVRVRLGNYWNTGLWGQADGIFGFVLPKYMSKLNRLIEDWRHGAPIKLASFAFKIPDRQIDREDKGVFLYIYPHSKS
jgi:SAM-dependent methyltransferase